MEGIWNDTREALNVVQEGDIVIFLWYWTPRSVFHELFDTPCPLDPRLLHTHRVGLPETGSFITFICIPVEDSARVDWQTLTLQAEFLSKHIHCLNSGPPKTYILEWSILYSLKDLWLFAPRMDFLSYHARSNGHIRASEIILMTKDWDYAAESLEEKEKREIGIRRVLDECCLVFERLEGGSIEHCWEFIRRVIDQRLDRLLDKGESAGRDAIFQIKRAVEDWRVRWIQREIDELYAELDKTPNGRQVRQRLKRALEDESKYLEPIVAQMDNEELAEEERQRLEEKMEEEYALSRREFQRYFEDIREMKIAIGPYLREFYRLPDPLQIKLKRFGIF
ncbi:hypothetical protein NP233_g8257 [Leucocoprinus birnbaumii]|uniref:Uncharacterized protein n=1 Tax=Leucocoprinus birnbaumii TaxID=56174 RepID=A0AAD5VMT4_9AGAR|nr:hypothetical protein NP233_g8257 [Leucocoprinus birnbaumii]